MSASLKMNLFLFQLHVSILTAHSEVNVHYNISVLQNISIIPYKMSHDFATVTILIKTSLFKHAITRLCFF